MTDENADQMSKLENRIEKLEKKIEDLCFVNLDLCLVLEVLVETTKVNPVIQIGDRKRRASAFFDAAWNASLGILNL